MDNTDSFAENLKKILDESVAVNNQILLKAVNTKDKIITSPFYSSNLKIEGDILTIPGPMKSNYLITQKNLHDWHFLKSTNINDDNNNLVFEFDIILFYKNKKGIFNNWKIEDASPPCLIVFENSNILPLIKLIKPFNDVRNINGEFTSARINRIKQQYGYNFKVAGNFAIPSKMNSDLFEVVNSHLIIQAMNNE